MAPHPAQATTPAAIDQAKFRSLLVQVLRDHEWSPIAAGCRCGWTQKKTLGRGSARLNHPHHVTGMLQVACGLNEGTQK
jgi:hypothetical protein